MDWEKSFNFCSISFSNATYLLREHFNTLKIVYNEKDIAWIPVYFFVNIWVYYLLKYLQKILKYI